MKLIPPQIYECSRMLRFPSFQAFCEYSLHRQKYGVKLWLPKFCKDLKLGLYPGEEGQIVRVWKLYMFEVIYRFYLEGDYLYEDLKEQDERPSEALIELAAKNPDLKLNRVIRDEKGHFTVICNFELDGNLC